MKFIAGMLVLWAAGVGLGAAGMLAGASVRRGWRRRAPRLVAWGGAGRDVQVGSFEDMARVAEQLIRAARERLSLIAYLTLLQEESNRRRQASAIARMNLMQDARVPPGEVYVISNTTRAEAQAEFDAGLRFARLYNIKDDSRRDA